MTLVAFSLAFALLAAQPLNEPEEDSTFSERQPVRLEPLPAARAFAAFRETCMAGISDPAAFDRAVAASDLGFTRSERGGDETHEWSSRHGQLVLHGPRERSRVPQRERRERSLERGPRLRWLARCDFWMAIDQRLEPDALIAALGTALAPGIRPVEEIVGTSWALPSPRQDAMLRLVHIPSTDPDPRLFTLSLQLAPAGPGTRPAG
jgi:hypothetical protein